jgi:signal transduction histidine kinase/ActR/RegA family two-component response regulator
MRPDPGVNILTSGKHIETHSGGAEPITEKKVNILLVDDHVENLLALEATLSQLNQNVLKALSGREALKMLLDQDLAVILLDVHMPDMDGFETARLIRGREKTQNIPIIFLTAMHKSETQVFKGYSLGAVDYIFKPFDPEILKAKVSVFIELYKKTEEIQRQAELLGQKNQELDENNKAILRLYKEIETKNDELEIRVQERTAELARANAALHDEIRERKKAEEERTQLLEREQEAREQAERANRAKDEFLATVSHELRTPLNAVLGWTRLLATGRLDEANYSRAIESIERNAKSQARLIEDLLDVSRIITGKMRLEIHAVEVGPIIEMTIDALRPAADAKAINIHLDIDPSVGQIPCDPNRLQQIVWNLMSNAVKFTPQGGKIEIRLEAIDSHARITVTDSGEGISTDFLPYVFERFRQAEGSITRKHGGLGLGLAIVRHLVEMHGGEISANSPGKDQGATFTVKLPLTSQVIAEPPPEDAEPVVVAEADNICAPACEAKLLEKLRILIVEDDQDTLRMLAELLAQHGAAVKPICSASEAMEEMERWEPDLLISDISMPGEDGYSLIGKVRAFGRKRGREIPAIALTALASADDRERMMTAGFQTHMPKPVEPARLIMAIASLTGRNGAAYEA